MCCCFQQQQQQQQQQRKKDWEIQKETSGANWGVTWPWLGYAACWSLVVSIWRMDYKLRVNMWPPPDCPSISQDKQQLQWCFSCRSISGPCHTTYVRMSCVCFYVLCSSRLSLIKQPGGRIQQQDEVDKLTPRCYKLWPPLNDLYRQKLFIY